MPGKVKDLLKQTFGRLRVVAEEGIIDRHCHWRCKCKCGNIITVRGTKLTDGTTTSCGCYRADPEIRRAARLQVSPAKRRAIARKGGAARWSETTPPR